MICGCRPAIGEALKGARVGQYSIRINGQWRICFRFKNGGALEVEIVGYH